LITCRSRSRVVSRTLAGEMLSSQAPAITGLLLDYICSLVGVLGRLGLVEQRLRELNPSTVSSLSPDNQSISLASAQFVFVAHAWQLSLSVPSHFSATTNNGDHTLTAGDLHIVRKCVVHIVSGELRTMYFYAAIW